MEPQTPLFPLADDTECVSEPSESIRILVVGDSFVGKSSLVHLLCHQQVANDVQTTVGADVDVMMHIRRRKSYWIEFLEVGGAPALEGPRKMWFKASFDAILGVYDATNINSRNNLDRWFREALGLERLEVLPWAHGQMPPLKLDLTRHPDRRLSGRILPVLIVGNKLDLVQKLQMRLASASHDDLLLSARDDFGVLGDEEKLAIFRQFIDATIEETRKNQNLLVSPPQNIDTTPVKLGLGASPFSTGGAKGRRGNRDVSEVSLRIDF